MTEQGIPAVHMAGITKVFENGVVANEEVTLVAEEGTIHAVVGENGAGKSTLMNILYGRYRPDAGRIRLWGQDVEFHSPADAIRAGIGMVTQHSSLIGALTLLENVLLSAEASPFSVLPRRRSLERLRELEASLGIALDWNERARSLSVATLQKAEIIRTLLRNARVLILDEPTAALAPQESEQLFQILHTLTESGRTVLLVTHRLREVVEHAQRVTVLRAGHAVAEMPVRATTVAELASLMVGPSKRVFLGGAWDLNEPEDLRPQGTVVPESPDMAIPARMPPQAPLPVLEVQNVSVPARPGSSGLQGVSLTVHAGEILGVAGVDGSGQRDLCEVIVGLQRPLSGRILLKGKEVTSLGMAARARRGLGYCPEDRQREGLIGPFTVAENLILGHHWEPEHGGGFRLNHRRISDVARLAIAAHHIEPPAPQEPVWALSGGNQQKVLIARALLGQPAVLVAMQMTRGLDMHATRRVYEVVSAARNHGLGVLLVSLDLEELLEVCSRLAVLYSGRIVSVLNRDEFDRERIGQMMTTGQVH